MVWTARSKWLLVATLFAAAIGLGLFAAPRPAAPLTDLRSLEDFRSRFNQDQGKPRLILLLSPT
ncbi:MAG: hypothetical protein ACREBG_21940 [Pyrinomonadaceae bacterium]